jgi:signal transduction histidine kinase
MPAGTATTNAQTASGGPTSCGFVDGDDLDHGRGINQLPTIQRSNDPTLHGDPVQLQQIVVNLMSNAIDAVSRKPEGQRRVSGRTRRMNGKEAEISITDSGPGIEPAALPQLFDRFFTTKEQGMGMGLPIAQTIAEAHGGKVVA